MKGVIIYDMTRNKTGTFLIPQVLKTKDMTEEVEKRKMIEIHR